jgi:hypothetical protein
VIVYSPVTWDPEIGSPGRHGRVVAALQADLAGTTRSGTGAGVPAKTHSE